MTTITERLREIATDVHMHGLTGSYAKLRAIAAELEAAPAGAHAAEPAAWVPMDECVPPVGTDVVLRLRYRDGPYHYAIDRWDVHREDPTGMGGPTIETGEDWNDNPGEDVSHWMALREPGSHPPAPDAAADASMPVVAHEAPDNEQPRVVTEHSMSTARKDGGASLSSMRPYCNALVRHRDAQAAIESRDERIAELVERSDRDDRIIAGLESDLCERDTRIASMRVEWGAEVAALTARIPHAMSVVPAKDPPYETDKPSVEA